MLEEYPSPVEGIGLENREVVKAAQGFESLFLRHKMCIRDRNNGTPIGNRNKEEFKEYYDKIWKDIDFHV